MGLRGMRTGSEIDFWPYPSYKGPIIVF